MNLYIIFALFFAIANHTLYATKQNSQESQISEQLITQPNINKKKVLIFTSKGGYGHTAACNALKPLLEPNYDVTIVNPFEKLLHRYDFVKKISNDSMDGEQFYNWLLQKDFLSFTNFMSKHIAPFLLRISNQTKEKLFRDYVMKENPDLVISVIPLLNLAISNAAHKKGIPFLLITTDGDLSLWINGLKRMAHQNFVTTVGFEIPPTRNKLRSCGINNNRIQHTGFPIRPDFLEKKDKQAIRKTWDFPDNKFTIMLMMGGAGSTLTYHYAKKIAEINPDAHLIVCIGKNEKLGRKISKIRLKDSLSLSIIPFTKQISDLMAVSDLLITKPGPGSINEALYQKLPMLIDKTATSLFWENANVELVVKNGWGDVIDSLDKVAPLITKYIDDKDYYQQIKHALKSYKRKNFSKSIMKIITQLCPPNNFQMAL